MARGKSEQRESGKKKQLLRSAEPLRGSQIIFGLEQTIEKGVCVRETEQQGRDGEERERRPTGEDKKGRVGG